MKLGSLKFGKNKNEVMEDEVVEQPEAALPPEPVAPVEEARPAPHGPMAELTLDAAPAIDDSDQAVDFGGIELPVMPDDDDDEDITVVEVQAGQVAEAKGEATGDTVEDDDDESPAEFSLNDSLSNLFGDNEEEENPLANLINSLPDVTVQELMDDIQEIKEIMQEWRQH